MIKTIFLNIIIFCALMFLLMLAAPTYATLEAYLRPASPERYAQRANLPALRDYEWAQQSLWEISLVRLQYRDFVVYRGIDIAGEFVNVENGIRRTIGAPQERGGAPVWFLGGSTTWGSGLSDAYTYPSMFAQQTGRPVTNHSERGYSSRQSLAYLQGLYLTNPEGSRTVVFYDGINEIMHSCHPSVHSINQTAMEPRYRGALRHQDRPFTYQRLFEQMVEFSPRVADRLGISEPEVVDYQCFEDPARAQAIADNLVAIWTHAQRLVEANGDQFLAIFQPVSFMSANVHPVLPDHPYNDELLLEYQTVYPLMQEALANSDVNYVDLSDIYDDCHDCYYDQVHVGPNGHQRLVDALIPIVP